MEVAEDGARALELLTEQKFDLVLMDCQMPEMDGYEATKIIRADDRFRDLPIIAMTAHAMESERQKCLSVGMNDHVTKPVDPEKLYAALAVTRGRPKTRPDPETPKAAPSPPAVTAPPAPPQDKPAKPATKPAANGDTEGLPDEIPGIDMEQARAMLRGNDVILRKLLGDFHAKYMEHAKKISSLLDEGDVETAERTAHTLKGVSGNLRAQRVFDAAKTLDDQLRADASDASVPKLLEELEQSLDEVRTSLSAVFGESDQSGAEQRAQAGE